MWPWEHLSIGYLLYSGTVRAIYRHSPLSDSVIVLGIATQLPDLIDKPGNWVFDVLPSGTSVGHSVFVAVPVSVAAVGLARKHGATEFGIAFGAGYLSHLLGDVVYPVLMGGGPAIGAVLWPFGPDYAPETRDALSIVTDFFTEYVVYLASPKGVAYVLLEAVFLSFTFLVWLRDGMPGVDRIRGLSERARR